MKSSRRHTTPALALLLAALAWTPATAEIAVDATIVDATTVRAAFAHGAPLVETAGYKVHASRRDAAGVAELHTRDTDIFYVLEGHAELVVGGAMKAGKEVAPGEVRADAIEGGVPRDIGAGEVIVIPNGVPHWFRRVDAPVVYYVVKVTGESSRE